MYKLSYVKFLIALAAVCPAVLNAQEQPTDLYYNKDLNTDGWSADRYMQNPAAWNVGSPDGEVFDGVVNSPNNNLYILPDYLITVEECNLFGYDSNSWSVHNFTAAVTANARYNVLLLPAEHNVNVGGDMNITVNNQGNWWSPDIRLYMEGGTSTTIAIEGDFKLVNATPPPSEDTPGNGATGIRFYIGNTIAWGGDF